MLQYLKCHKVDVPKRSACKVEKDGGESFPHLDVGPISKKKMKLDVSIHVACV
jgi:hypothetical protein